jgi:dTDP-4-dehydrorhamnose 3,5-epimerase
LQGVVVLVPDVFQDHRGQFTETFRVDYFSACGLSAGFVQDNESISVRNVIRGLHFQWDPPMGKLMRVSYGSAFLVAVDIRNGSPTLGQWFGIEASAENRRQVWAPAGFARGFCVLSEQAQVLYKCTGLHNSAAESAILWSDQDLAIRWPVTAPILSDKDRNAQTLAEWISRPEARRFV